LKKLKTLAPFHPPCFLADMTRMLHGRALTMVGFFALLALEWCAACGASQVRVVSAAVDVM